ncbi:hypothetical protein HZS_6801 [Henneguya salminicola]|nr:hypothetical protein HZS_6801 [Henneguya salminicola]
MEERKHKLLLYFFISATLLHSLSIDIIVPCGSSYTISIQEDSTSWISSEWVFPQKNVKRLPFLVYEKNQGEYHATDTIFRQSIFILDYGVHYLSLYQMSLMFNNSRITFTSYSKQNGKKIILFREVYKIIITGKINSIKYKLFCRYYAKK